MKVLIIILSVILYCAGFILVIQFAKWAIGKLVNFFDERKRNKSPFLIIKRKLEDDLRQANFSGDWRKRQDINLKLLWLKTYYDIKSEMLSNSNQDYDETALIAKFRENDFKFPIKWELDDFYCFPFSQEIVGAYGKVLAENAYKGAFKPNNILPVPKEFIIKAIHYTFDYIGQKESMYHVSDKDKLAENLSSIHIFLLKSFIDTGDDDLPTESLENYKAGKEYRDGQIKYDAVTELKLIDWRSEAEWIARGIQYAEKEQFDLAFACYDQAKKVAPGSKDLKTMLAITYLTIGERQFDKGEKQLALENIKKSAELKNEEAIKWLAEHQHLNNVTTTNLTASSDLSSNRPWRPENQYDFHFNKMLNRIKESRPNLFGGRVSTENPFRQEDFIDHIDIWWSGAGGILSFKQNSNMSDAIKEEVMEAFSASYPPPDPVVASVF